MYVQFFRTQKHQVSADILHIETTHKYMIADMELKRKVMEKVGSAGNSSYKYKPSADIMNFLNSL